MGNSRDREFMRWGVHEMGVQKMGSLREEEFRKWRVYEMWSSADGKLTR